jgi:NAD(P)-dependent dehydrogenase (short-subunit alcohol dehydrogenase family)
MFVEFFYLNLGAIVNVASVAAIYGNVAGTSYTTSKHAVIGLTKSTAFFYTKKGIRCNCICPGGVKFVLLYSFSIFLKTKFK